MLPLGDAGAADIDGCTVDQNLPTRATQYTEQGQKKFALALAIKTTKPHHFTSAPLHGYIPQPVGPAQLAHFQKRGVSRRRWGRFRRKCAAVFPTNHQLNHFIVGLGSGFVTCHIAAIAEVTGSAIRRIKQILDNDESSPRDWLRAAALVFNEGRNSEAVEIREMIRQLQDAVEQRP